MSAGVPQIDIRKDAGMISKNRNAQAPTGYDSVVLADYFAVEGVADGATGCHYDYRLQVWVDGHDHAHVDADCLLSPLFCGSDVATCQGGAA